ncbi:MULTISPECIES: hypothetical protein [Streptomycetaceae]|uniref:hypothetical protein n=1 Tax=Streptomycetaceae TaxID=2062 RepID=UPI000213D9BA|nr:MULTISPECIES: hypothetical protein [Streptomycetaceae]MYS57754.1 hypothetical protein [Streptomyces sp. SID5468]CCB73378.1 Conserved hypothetical protein [Streptantibioticus cattleyicolor NRRL 8057 = DSM 46488]
MAGQPRVVVHPYSGGGRRVTIDGEPVGVAASPVDVVEFLRRAGLDPDDVALEDASLIEWRGGGPDVWG